MVMLTPDLLLQAYAAGIFPMAESAADPELFWVDPVRRGVLPLDRLISHRLPLDEVERGFDLLRSGEALRVVLELSASGSG